MIQSIIQGVLLLTACFVSLGSWSQLDTIHWVPPLHSRDTGQINDHYLYLSTPSVDPVEVTIRDGSGASFGDSPYTVQNGAPLEIYVENGQTSGSKLMVAENELNTTLDNRGLIIESTEPIFCNARYRSNWQAEALTSKGSKAKGTTFRFGAMPISNQAGIRSFVFGIMATEEAVQVQVSNYNPQVVFAGIPTVNDDNLSFTLNAGECRVYSGYANSDANLAGMIGALIQSSGDIVVNIGNWCGSIGTGAGNQDIGADQIVPVPYLGQDHILVEGIGDSSQERGLVVAHYPNTAVYLNGSATPSVTLQPGEWYLTPNSAYTGAPHSNVYIRLSEPAYVYQFLAGSSSQSTPGLNFIPPISCGMPHSVDEIPSIQSIGSTNYSGGIFAITEENATLTIDGVVYGGGVVVDGFDGWETYRILNLTGDITVESSGPVAVGLFGSSADAGFSGYYSGFSLNIDAAFEAPDFVCWGDDATFEFSGDTLGGGVLDWDFGLLDFEDFGDDLFVASDVDPGSYDVSLHVTGDLCADSSFHTVTFYPPYSGQSAASACESYVWNGNAYSSTGIFLDTLTSATGCDSLVELDLNIMPLPDPMLVDWMSDTLVYCPVPGSLLFGVEADPLYQLSWTFWAEGSNDSIPLPSPIAASAYYGPGLYQIIYATGAPCYFSATGTIAVEIEDCSITIPNVFSPNGDGKNDRFYVDGLFSIQNARMQIFNRWGNLMFNDDDFGSSAGWDPRLTASEGTYYYILEIPILTEELAITGIGGPEIVEGPQTVIYQGSLTLVR
ncbi:gliding motility-associated C-terminal domain-containing protein [Flavobacteriales bacterium]|nr:gliding motility-associated C-terminal domain-containing protein [Flavobacteriales bacterium]